MNLVADHEYIICIMMLKFYNIIYNNIVDINNDLVMTYN